MRSAHAQLLTQTMLSLSLLFTFATARALDCTEGFDAAVTGDYAAALKPMTKCAEAGGADEQFYLGVMYEQGLGATQDYELAAQWYRKAARQGNDKAQHNLGRLYANGLGVARDLVVACQWWEIAAGAGNPDAADERAHASATMTDTQLAVAKARARKCVSSNFRSCG